MDVLLSSEELAMLGVEVVGTAYFTRPGTGDGVNLVMRNVTTGKTYAINGRDGSEFDGDLVEVEECKSYTLKENTNES